MKGARAVPAWQQRLLHVCLALIVAAVFSALVLAPFLLSRNMETADTSAMRSELFELHLGIDALQGALRDWQQGRAGGAVPDASLGLRLDERTQLLAHRISVVLAYPGAAAVLPENAGTLERTRDRLAALLARPDGAPGDAVALRDQAAELLGPDLVALDRYLGHAFRRLGQITANDRWQLARIGLAAQRLASFLLVVGVLTLAVLWMQHRVLRRAEVSLNTVMGDLAEAQRIAHIGTVRRDYERDIVTWSPEFARIHGLDPDGRMTGAQFESLLLPADADKVMDSERQALARSAEIRAPVRRDLTFRALRADGEVIELEVQSELTANPDGSPQGMVSTVRDITVEARARRALRESERSLAAAQRIARLGSFRHNYSTGRTSWSSELYVVLGCDPADGPRPLRQIVHPEDFGGVEALFAELLGGGPPGGQRQASFDCRVLHPDGTGRFVRGTAEMNYDGAGAPDMLTGSLQDVTDDIEQERALRDALTLAERANTAKSEFLAVMSHELRTPMNGVLGMLGAIEATPLDDRQRDQIRVACTSAEALLAILNDVLDMSKIEAGRMELEERPFALRPLVTGVADLYSESARAKGVALTVRVADGLPAWITGDPLRIRQILANLVSNAVKFTPAGQVTLDVDHAPDSAARKGGPWLRLCVTDTGIGIPVDRQQHVFGRFNQLDTSYTRRFGGTGLGLAISRSLADLMGGRIGFASMAGRGSSFWLDVRAVAAEPQADARDLCPQTPLPRLSVLVAEDNATNRLVAGSMLERLGQGTAFAADGQGALDALGRGGFDLVLMDISMPGMDGIEATRRIRRMDGPVSKVPVLALTAHAGSAERNACLEAGCNEVLTKPLDPDSLRRALHRWLPPGAPAAPAPAGPPPGAAPPGPDDGARNGLRNGPRTDLDGRLAELARQIGPEALPLLLEASLEDLARHRATVERAAAGQAGDHAAVVRACHSLVGIAATLGLDDTAQAARRHETALQAGTGDPAPLLDLIRETEAALSRAARAVPPAPETVAP